MTAKPRVAVVTFPGSNDDHDAAWALGAVGADPVAVWHQDAHLPAGTAGVVACREGSRTATTYARARSPASRR